ncbi:hypothetical protein SNEBB_006866 [Seison nebaliae]|nr:hypothetical protein SNEBB_006866 [Seison nebaliae]
MTVVDSLALCTLFFEDTVSLKAKIFDQMKEATQQSTMSTNSIATSTLTELQKYFTLFNTTYDFTTLSTTPRMEDMVLSNMEVENQIWNRLNLVDSSEFACKSIMFLRYFNRIASSWLIVAFTMERMIVVFFPLKRSKWCTHKISRIITGISVIISIIICAIVPYMFTLRISNVHKMKETFIPTTNAIPLSTNISMVSSSSPALLSSSSASDSSSLIWNDFLIELTTTTINRLLKQQQKNAEIQKFRQSSTMFCGISAVVFGTSMFTWYTFCYVTLTLVVPLLVLCTLNSLIIIRVTRHNNKQKRLFYSTTKNILHVPNGNSSNNHNSTSNILADRYVQRLKLTKIYHRLLSTSNLASNNNKKKMESNKLTTYSAVCLNDHCQLRVPENTKKFSLSERQSRQDLQTNLTRTKFCSAPLGSIESFDSNDLTYDEEEEEEQLTTNRINKVSSNIFNTHSIKTNTIADRSSIRITSMLVTVSLAFCICNLPYVAIYFVRYFMRKQISKENEIKIFSITQYLEVLHFMNYGVNVLLYCMSGKLFRRHLSMMCNRTIRFNIFCKKGPSISKITTSYI